MSTPAPLELSLLDRFLLPLTIWREARGESDLGMLLVALVVLNRTRDADHRWPRRVAEVILQPKQFSAFNPTDPNAVLWPHDTDDSWARSQKAADAAVASVIGVVLTHPGAKANHYHTRAVKPTWAANRTPAHAEGAHVFYEL